MEGIGLALMLMHCNGDLDELWIGICCLSQKFVWLIASVFTYLHRVRESEGVCEAIEMEREMEGKRRDVVVQSRRVIKVALCM